MSKTKLLPADLTKAAPRPVKDAEARVIAAKEAHEDALTARLAAEAALASAPDEDKAALAAAVEQGKPTPTATKPTREAELEATARREGAALELYRSAAAQFIRELAEHKAPLIGAQMPRVQAAADDAAKTLVTLVGQLDVLAREAGVVSALRDPRKGQNPDAAERARQTNRRPPVFLPSFAPTAVQGAEHIAALRGAIDALTKAPLDVQILEAAGDRPATWEAVAEKLGVRANDRDACMVRGWLLEDRRLEWCSADGQPIAPVGRTLSLTERFLQPVTDPVRKLSPTQRARAEAAARAA
jgi:hypothetical protein